MVGTGGGVGRARKCDGVVSRHIMLTVFGPA